jgi:hypothetical protein
LLPLKMKNDLLTTGVWKSLSSAAKRARNPVYVAVAYFGNGASKLPPLPANSRLVVDASEHAVKSGQTCPADLKKLQKCGVVIYSAPHLHAKVYVFDGFAFIGSANVSNHSAGTLIEAMLHTTDRKIINSARSFVRGLCLHELSPGAIDRLHLIYRPPDFPKGDPHRRMARHKRPTLPRILLAQLEPEEPPAGSESTQERGLRIARSRRKHGRSYVVDYLWWSGKSPYRDGDKIVQVIEEKRGHRLITPPADILYTRAWRRKGRLVTFVYFEHPNVRRTKFEKLARRLGYGAKKKLFRNGVVRDQAFAEKLLGSWSRV